MPRSIKKKLVYQAKHLLNFILFGYNVYFIERFKTPNFRQASLPRSILVVPVFKKQSQEK